MAREVTALTSEEPGKPRRGGSIVSFFKELPILIGLALSIALVIKLFLVQAFFIPSPSMVPTLEIRDRVLVNKLTYRFHQPERGDVVVFKEPYGNPCQKDQQPGFSQPEECTYSIPKKAVVWMADLFGIPMGADIANKDYIKRIVALPGETLELRQGESYINGKRVKLPSTAGPGGRGPQLDDADLGPIKIPARHYYVMGDNRGNSSDSRAFGSIDRGKILGKAFVLIWPPKRFSGL